MEEDIYGKEWLIRELASRASFTISDVRVLWNTLEDIIKEKIKNKSELIIPGLFKIYVKEIKAHKGHNAVKNEPMEVPDSYRICFVASRALLDLLKKK
jgi:nucleoid DNA-binding protein